MLTIQDLTPADTHCVDCALNAIERYWGVRVEVYREYAPTKNQPLRVMLVALITHPEHQAELDGFKGIKIEKQPTKHYPLDLQYISLIAMLNICIHAHMAR